MPEQTKCPLYAKHCGGCQLLHQPYAVQLANKQKDMQRFLGRFAPVRSIIGMDEPFHTRNKAIAAFANQGGKLVCGMFATNSHRVLATTDCLLHAELLNQTLAAVLHTAHSCRYTAYDEDRGTGLLRYAVLRWGHTSGQVLVTIVTPTPNFPGSRNFVAALRKAAPWVTTVVQNINPTQSSAVLGNAEKTLFGTGIITDTLCGLEFAISSRSFYQINPVQTERLYAEALSAAALTGKESVLDIYCGIGTIGLCAAPHAKAVLGVERNPAAVRDAIGNARRSRIENARFLCADATEWMVNAAAQSDTAKPDVIFLDPPREGSTPACIEAICRLAPKRVVYVSCNPETLARDVVLFGRRGYRAQWFQPVDMFPMTSHVETVVLLRTEK